MTVGSRGRGVVRAHKPYKKRAPSTREAEFRRLLQETEYSTTECFRKSGYSAPPCQHYWMIAAEYRQSIDSIRWIDLATGEIRPLRVCTLTCAAEKVGLSKKTIARRILEGLVVPARVPSMAHAHNLSSADLVTLAKIGKKHGGHRVVTESDVHRIRSLAKTKTHGQIAKDYNVSRRQISRIVSGERWGWLKAKKGRAA